MPSYHRLKRTFTSGEVTPILEVRSDFKKLQAGCKTLKNMVCLPQGAVTRRPGTKYVFDLTAHGLDLNKTDIRYLPFIFNKQEAYCLILYYHVSGLPRMIFGKQDGTILVYPDPPPTECPAGNAISVNAGDVVYLDLPSTLVLSELDWAQSADEMYIAQRATPPFRIVRHAEYCWTVETLTFVDPPVEWQSPSSWPRKVTMHQQRLVYGSNLTHRQTVWLSKANFFLTFTPAATGGIKPDDAITFRLDSGTQNRITWLLSGKALFIGTMGNEWAVTGSNRSALTPDNVLAQRQTNSGSEDIKPLMIGLAALFVERHGRTTNEFIYDYNYDSYKNADISVLSPHLTEHYSIVDWAYQQVPHRILWCIRQDGTLIALTYQREHKVLGWHRHATQGNFHAVTSIPGPDRDDLLWVAVSREIEGQSKVYVEIMSPFFKGDTAKDSEFLDSASVQENLSSSTITGLNHLEGKVVSVLVDGSVHPDCTVENGEITLSYSNFNKVVVGLSYDSEVRPFLPDIEGKDGTVLGRMQRIKSLDIFFYKTLGAHIGRSSTHNTDQVEELPFRVPTDLTGQAVPLYTGVYHVEFMEGFDRKSEYFIRQTQPLPMTVLGIVDTVEVS